ncbi:hypothetical protein B0H14DRAFT_2700268, partial [Mycena olivaceomarginata]
MPLLSIFSFRASRVFPILMSVSLVLSLCNFSPSSSFFLSLLPPPSPSLTRSFLPAHPPAATLPARALTIDRRGVPFFRLLSLAPAVVACRSLVTSTV